LEENLEAAIFWFRELPWGQYFGGPKWELIAKKILELYKLPELKSLEKNENKWNVIRYNLSFLRELVVLIDTLNSIAHNSNIVLSDMRGIGGWFLFALEAKKHAKHPASLALLAKNYGLLKYYHKEVFPLNSNEKDFYKEDRKNLNQQIVDFIVRDAVSPSSKNKANLPYLTNDVIPEIEDKYLLRRIYNVVKHVFLNEFDKYIALYVEDNKNLTEKRVVTLFTGKLMGILDGIIYNSKISPEDSLVRDANNLKNKIYESRGQEYNALV
jgi:hypothetical protein